MRMRKIIFFMAVAVCGARCWASETIGVYTNSELDVTVNVDFWNTTAHTNAVYASVQVAAAETDVDMPVVMRRESPNYLSNGIFDAQILYPGKSSWELKFSSHPIGTFLSLR